MTRIKLCGLSRLQDIETANTLLPEYVGFVFAPKSRRYVTRQHAAELKKHLAPGIRAVGVFVDEPPENVAKIVKRGVIDLVQLHGGEDETYLRRLRELTAVPLIQAFRIRSGKDLAAAERSTADYVLLDAGAGDGGTEHRGLRAPGRGRRGREGVRLVSSGELPAAVFSCRRTGSGKRGAGGPDAASLCGGCEQRH